MTDEDKCLKCGRCCCVKVIIDGRIIYTPYPCKHLDTRTKLCTIYKDRHTINPDCLTVEEGIRIGVFPADCPYVKDLPGYVPPVTKISKKGDGAPLVAERTL